MRKRFNRVAVASSSCYSSSKKAHVAYLKEQHNINSTALLAIVSRPVVVNELSKFESNLVAQIAAYKKGKSIKSMQDFKREHISSLPKISGLLKGKLQHTLKSK